MVTDVPVFGKIFFGFGGSGVGAGGKSSVGAGGYCVGVGGTTLTIFVS